MDDYQDRRSRSARGERKAAQRSKRDYCEYLKKLGRWDEYYSCARKRRYRTKAEALQSAQWRANQTSSALYCYECRYCGGWHISHKDGRDGRYDFMRKERQYGGGPNPSSRAVQQAAAFSVGDSVLDSVSLDICSVGEVDLSQGEPLYGLYSTADVSWVRWARESDLEAL